MYQGQKIIELFMNDGDRKYVVGVFPLKLNGDHPFSVTKPILVKQPTFDTIPRERFIK